MPPMGAGDLDDVGKIAKNMAHKEYFIYENVIEKPRIRCLLHSLKAGRLGLSDQMVGRILDKLEPPGKQTRPSSFCGRIMAIIWATRRAV